MAIKWLLQMHQQQRLTSDTLFSAAAYFARLLAKRSISKHHLQLSAVTCIWFALKIEERINLRPKDLCAICDEGYTPDDFLECERDLINALEFRFNYPTAKLFLRRLLDVLEPDDATLEVANFYCELSIVYLDHSRRTWRHSRQRAYRSCA